MRKNKFGEAYCESVAEARQIIDEGESEWAVYATSFEPPEGEHKATAEIRENQDGELVCYIEAATLDEVKAIVRELKIEEF